MKEYDVQEDIKISESPDRFGKLKKDEEASFYFAAFNDKGRARLFVEDTIYVSAKKGAAFNGYIIAPENDEERRKLVAQFGPVKTRFFSVVYVYDLDRKNHIVEPVEGKLMTFTFGTDKWKPIKAIQDEWGLANHDLHAVCTEDNFQRWNITHNRGTMFEKLEGRDEVLKQANAMFDDCGRQLGRELLDGEVDQILNGEVIEGFTAAVSDAKTDRP